MGNQLTEDINPHNIFRRRKKVYFSMGVGFFKPLDLTKKGKKKSSLERSRQLIEILEEAQRIEKEKRLEKIEEANELIEIQRTNWHYKRIQDANNLWDIRGDVIYEDLEKNCESYLAGLDAIPVTPQKKN